MAKLPRLTGQKAEKLLFKAGFGMIRSKGSHRIYKKGDRRIIVPFHASRQNSSLSFLIRKNEEKNS